MGCVSAVVACPCSSDIPLNRSAVSIPLSGTTRTSWGDWVPRHRPLYSDSPSCRALCLLGVPKAYCRSGVSRPREKGPGRHPCVGKLRALGRGDVVRRIDAPHLSLSVTVIEGPHAGELSPRATKHATVATVATNVHQDGLFQTRTALPPATTRLTRRPPAKPVPPLRRHVVIPEHISRNLQNSHPGFPPDLRWPYRDTPLCTVHP